ncbi:MAG: uncharacterized protein KVP18_004791 [Porospora cf. gigantea A]|uniref:uncharacterized protein n=1 Tax=Porospora cf. gigantea A TaxID=2853593 RepID=UPI00355A9FDF|nr:MAG: hypothetical protein KVP18_004791 [Porospora cf. gigantea A]
MVAVSIANSPLSWWLFKEWSQSEDVDLLERLQTCEDCRTAEAELEALLLSPSLNTRVPPPIPLARAHSLVFFMTEAPFLILWTYAVYWLVLVSRTHKGAPTEIWLAAVASGLLVGLGLNANAYRYLFAPRPRRRSECVETLRRLIIAVRSRRVTLGGCSPSSPSTQLNTYLHRLSFFKAVQRPRLFPRQQDWVFDFGTSLRFFVIPFGISAMSGLTRQHKDDFFLVFPRDPAELIYYLTVPAVVICLLFFLRLGLLLHLKVDWSVSTPLFNGRLCD